MSITVQSPSEIHTSLATAVPREYVHKTAQSEVLLTGWLPTGPDRYCVTARWPVDHTFYGPVRGFHDPLLVAESVRQAVPLLSHMAYDVPFGHRQSWSHFRYETDPAALAVTGFPAEVEMRITCSGVVRRGSRLASMNMHVILFIDGLPLGTAEAGFCNHPPAIYRRLRGRYADIAESTRLAIPLAPPTAPDHVARTQFTDVVLSPTNSPLRTQLRVDLTHPALFDHPVDHAPGMLLLEAARQSAHSTAHPQPVMATAMNAVFTRYVELDAPCWIHAVPLADAKDGMKPVWISAVQNDACAFTSVTTMAPVPRR